MCCKMAVNKRVNLCWQLNYECEWETAVILQLIIHDANTGPPNDAPSITDQSIINSD